MTLDCTGTFHGLRLSPDAAKKSAFITHLGKLKWNICSGTWVWWLRHIGCRRPYGDLCGGDALPSGDLQEQYTPYCSNQRPMRLLFVVLLYFFKGAASLVCGGGVVLVPEVLNNIRLASNTFKLCGATTRWCRYMAAPAYTVLKTNIINKLKLYSIRFVRRGWCIRHMA